MASRLNLEHAVLKALGKGRKPEKWLLAVSGGLDSMVLAEILFRWRRYLKVELVIAHVHHGGSEDPSTRAYRKHTQKFVRSWAEANSLGFLTNAAGKAVRTSENELRSFRQKELCRWFTEGDFDQLVFAHHADDLLETRLLRLIRGTGPQGLKSMSVRRAHILRPLLQVSRAELAAYAQAEKIEFVEDPSNANESMSLRNWLRKAWLPALEERSKGARRALARSLAQCAHDEFTETIGPYVGLRRKALVSASPLQRPDIVARYFRSLGMKNYSQEHVHELLKRLSTRRKPVNFEMLGHTFECSPDFLWASRV